jgi:HEAT repeat protein
VILALALALAAVAADERLERLAADVRGRDERVRRKAVQELAAYDTAGAWELVIEALDDPNSQVADEAQLQVARIDDPPSLELLLGKEGLQSKDEWVRARVVEGIGRMQEPPGASLVAKSLSDKDALVRRTAAWTLERLAAAGKAPLDDAKLVQTVSRRAAKGADLEEQAAMVVAWGALAPAQRTTLCSDFARRKEPPLAVAAYLVARALDVDTALASTAGAHERESLSVRIAAAELLAAKPAKRTAGAIVELLEREQEATGRQRMLDLLRGLAGESRGLQPRAWRAWVDSLPDDWAGGAGAAPVEDGGDEPRTVAFAGLTIRSPRVAFLIDLSGSVWELGKQGRTKKQVIDEELRKALLALPEETRFNVIPYTATPRPWQERIVAAEAKNVEDALEFFVECKDNGTGNFWDALLLALEDPDVDTVVVLTDGAPTGGRRWNLELMKELFAERNRFRRVVLEAILANARPPLKKPWIEMCASSGGRVVEIDLE